VFDDPEAQCRKILAPYASLIHQIPIAAWERYAALPELDRSMWSSTARANVISSYMVSSAKELLGQISEVRAIDNHVSSIFLVQDRVVLRFKKLDRSLLSSNYQTPRAIEYNDTGLHLPGIGVPALRVDIGYRLNVVETNIDAVFVVRRKRKRVLWAFDLARLVAGDVLPEQMPLEVAPAAEVLPRVRRRAQSDEAKILPFKNASSND
jgi:hypothetical protein